MPSPRSAFPPWRYMCLSPLAQARAPRGAPHRIHIWSLLPPRGTLWRWYPPSCLCCIRIPCRAWHSPRFQDCRLTLLWFGVLFYSFISIFMFRSVMPNFLFAEQVTVRSCPCEREQKPSVVNFVNQQPIRLNMAFSITKIIS